MKKKIERYFKAVIMVFLLFQCKAKVEEFSLEELVSVRVIPADSSFVAGQKDPIGIEVRIHPDAKGPFQKVTAFTEAGTFVGGDTSLTIDLTYKKNVDTAVLLAGDQAGFYFVYAQVDEADLVAKDTLRLEPNPNELQCDSVNCDTVSCVIMDYGIIVCDSVNCLYRNCY